MTIEQKEQQIELLSSQNRTAYNISYAASFLGGVAGVIIANKMGYKFLGKVVFYVVGATAIGIPMNLIYSNKIAERKSKISLLKTEIEKDIAKLPRNNPTITK